MPRREFVGGNIEHLARRPIGQELLQEITQRLGRGCVAVGEVFQHREIFSRRENFTVRRCTVTPGATDLLRVVFNAFREIIVIDRADVRLVDPHAERDGRDDDGPVRRHEAVLHGLAHLCLHARVIGLGGEPDRDQRRRDVLGSFLECHVDDGRAQGSRPEPFDQYVDSLRRRARRHAQKKIRPIEARVDVGLGRDGKRAADVLRDRRCRRRGECQHAPYFQLLGVARELQVVGPEIVTPLGNAMRLIDHQQIDPQCFQLGEKPFVGETLGCDVEEF